MNGLAPYLHFGEKALVLCGNPFFCWLARRISDFSKTHHYDAARPAQRRQPPPPRTPGAETAARIQHRDFLDGAARLGEEADGADDVAGPPSLGTPK